MDIDHANLQRLRRSETPAMEASQAFGEGMVETSGEGEPGASDDEVLGTRGQEEPRASDDEVLRTREREEPRASDDEVVEPRGEDQAEAPRNEKPESAASTESAGSAGDGLRVLYVEDLADAGELAKLVLEMMGHEVVTALDGPTALEIADRFYPDVVILDIGLPGMDGYEVARRIRGHPELRDVMLIAITGYSQDSDRRRSQEAGFDHHLVKPVDYLGTVRAILEDVVPPAKRRGR